MQGQVILKRGHHCCQNASIRHARKNGHGLPEFQSLFRTDRRGNLTLAPTKVKQQSKSEAVAYGEHHLQKSVYRIKPQPILVPYLAVAQRIAIARALAIAGCHSF